MTTADVLAGKALWSIEQGDVLAWLVSLPADSVDLLVTSPPYERARLYLEDGQDLSVARNTEDWVAWMVEVAHAARRVCKGLCAFVVEGQTRSYRYTASPFLLLADLHRAGFHLRKPPIYRRVGIPGSGGPDWLRNDYEPIVCFTRGGRLPWSDNTACGHTPKWAPGGEMSNRLANGARVNKWGMTGNGPESRLPDNIRRKRSPSSTVGSEVTPEVEDGLFGPIEEAPVPVWTNRHGMTEADHTGAARKVVKRASHTKKMYARNQDGQRDQDEHYSPPAIANPGNVISCLAGGGTMGNTLAHENEAPFPEDLAAFFVLSFCPPGGIVCDPFSGSGTTGAMSIRNGRRFIGCDLRPSQVALSHRRISGETPSLFSQPTREAEEGPS